MKLDEFRDDYDFALNISKVGRTVNVSTSILDKNDKKVVDKVEDKLDIPKTNDLIADYETTWGDIIEESKRAQLDHFMKKYKITDCLPKNKETEIDEIYSEINDRVD